MILKLFKSLCDRYFEAKIRKDLDHIKLYQVFMLMHTHCFFFFSSSDMQKFRHLLGCHTIGINSSLVFFKCFTFFSNLICQAKYLMIFL